MVSCDEVGKNSLGRDVPEVPGGGEQLDGYLTYWETLEGKIDDEQYRACKADAAGYRHRRPGGGRMPACSIFRHFHGCRSLKGLSNRSITWNITGD